jgi:hypothetical protein
MRHIINSLLSISEAVMKRKHKEMWDDYRTKPIFFEIDDAMQEFIRTGQLYQTRLDPPPANSRCCHPTREVTQ